MHVHLPKPLHGWREFLGEVGVIVIGVLIALFAEQIAERINWTKHVREAREDLHGELQADLFNAQERVLMAPCIERRLGQLDQIIDHPPVGPWKMLPGRRVIPIRVWSSSGWDSAVAADTITHMGTKQRAQYAGVYAFVRKMDQLARDEFAVATELKTLEHGGPLSEVSKDRLRTDVARVRGYNEVMVLGSRQFSELVRALGIELTPESRQELASLTCPMPGDTLPGGAV